jgi:hypothetical protein
MGLHWRVDAPADTSDRMAGVFGGGMDDLSLAARKDRKMTEFILGFLFGWITFVVFIGLLCYIIGNHADTPYKPWKNP